MLCHFGADESGRHGVAVWAVKRTRMTLLGTDGPRLQGKARRRKGDCRRRPKRSRGDEPSREAIERIHGDWGVGGKNEEGDRVTDLAIYRSLIHSS